jgi:thiol-disulfide isomerase/thioredoxin
MKNNILYSLLICLIPFMGHANPKTDSIFYIVNGTVKGLKAQKAYLGIYALNKMYLTDSSAIDSFNGKFEFKNKKKSREGLYFISVDTSWLFDIILTKENKNVEFITDTRDVLGNLIFKNSKENQAYINVTNQMNLSRKKLESMALFAKMLMQASKDKEVMKEHQVRIKQVYQEMDSITEVSSKLYKGTFFENLLNASKNVKVPEDIKENINGKFNPVFFNYILNNYWKNFNFKDERLLTTKILKAKIDLYFEKMVPRYADSMYIYIDKLMLQAKENQVVYNEVLRILTQKYDDINLMGGDAILIHLVDKYHHNPLSTTMKEQMEALDYRANLYRPNVIGKIAPDFTLKNERDSTYNLHNSINKFTVLFFYSSLCSHCKASMPTIAETYNLYKDKGFSFVAINNDPDIGLWKGFLAENPSYDWINLYEKGENSKLVDLYAAYFLPAIYILDENKKIIAKRMKPEDLQGILKTINQ